MGLLFLVALSLYLGGLMIYRSGKVDPKFYGDSGSSTVTFQGKIEAAEERWVSSKDEN